MALTPDQVTSATGGKAPAAGENTEGLLAKLMNEGAIGIPPHDYEVRTYVGVTNNVSTRIFKRGGSAGTVVCTLTYTYIAAGAADSDDIATITRS